MAITLFLFCSLLLGTSLGQQTSGDRILNQVFRFVGDLVNREIDTPRAIVTLTKKLVDTGLEYGTNLGRMVVAAGAKLTSQGLGGGTHLGKQALDLVGTMGEYIPLAGTPTRLVTDASKIVLDVGNYIGQKGINGTSFVGDKLLQGTNQITKITTGTIENLISSTTGLTQNTVSTSLNAVANVLNKVMDAFMAFLPSNT